MKDCKACLNFEFNGECVTSCPAHTFPHANRSCLACDSECLSCTGPLASQCVKVVSLSVSLSLSLSLPPSLPLSLCLASYHDLLCCLLSSSSAVARYSTIRVSPPVPLAPTLTATRSVAHAIPFVVPLLSLTPHSHPHPSRCQLIILSLLV